MKKPRWTLWLMFAVLTAACTILAGMKSGGFQGFALMCRASGRFCVALVLSCLYTRACRRIAPINPTMAIVAAPAIHTAIVCFSLCVSSSIDGPSARVNWHFLAVCYFGGTMLLVAIDQLFQADPRRDCAYFPQFQTANSMQLIACWASVIWIYFVAVEIDIYQTLQIRASIISPRPTLFGTTILFTGAWLLDSLQRERKGTLVAAAGSVVGSALLLAPVAWGCIRG